jgi:N-acetylgalactosamine kinase
MEKIQDDYVPVKLGLNDIYDDTMGQVSTVHVPRYCRLLRRFEEVYGEKPRYFSRAPGRVNIIGEHIDYCGYAVLPAALEQDMIIAFKESAEAAIEVHNDVENIYNHMKFPTDKDIKFVEQKEDKWVNYFLAAFKHIAQQKNPDLKTGYKVLISSTVPIDAGLSSSAAFSVSSTLVPLMVYGLRDKYTRSEMVQHIINYERSVGVACGGMDQTISVFAERGTAKLIEFNPIKAHTVNIPAKFVAKALHA